MATTFASIYDKFEPMITDATLLLGNGSLDEDILFSCLGLVINISLIGVPLSFRAKLDTIDIVAKEFTDDLTTQEEYIIASAMRTHWIEPFINDTDYLMTATGGTKDFSEGSHANLLDKMTVIKDRYELATDNMMVAYSLEVGSLEELS